LPKAQIYKYFLSNSFHLPGLNGQADTTAHIQTHGFLSFQSVFPKNLSRSQTDFFRIPVEIFLEKSNSFMYNKNDTFKPRNM